LKVDQPGTYWYHSHIDGQYPDGLRGPLIIHDPDSPYAGQYDEELVLTLSDWYHDEMPQLIKSFINVANPIGAEPVPKSALMNETQNLQINIQPAKTYFVRLINIAAFAAQYFWIEGHTFRIIEVDGVWTEPAETNMIYITAAQRYGFLLTTKNQTEINYAIHGAMDTDLFDKVPKTLNPNVTSYLMYNPSEPLPLSSYDEPLNPFDDFGLVPVDGEELFKDPDQLVLLNLKMDNLGDGANYAFFNDITYVRPKVPSLYTAMTTGEYASNSVVYGIFTNSFVLSYSQVVEIVVNNHDKGKHPFHLHGHNFQAVVRGDDNGGDYNPENFFDGADDNGGYDFHNMTMPAVPMRRDTFLVRPNSHIVLRFRSDNPGVWLFHCHIEWHVDSGLIATMVEAPLELQSRLNIPKDHYSACAASTPPVPTAGNAAARTDDLLNLMGSTLPPPPLPPGFTPRGIIALIFSALAAVVGMFAVAWYGMGELSALELERVKRRIAQAGDGVLRDADSTVARVC
jgi:iron transport multicopper oxidase